MSEEKEKSPEVIVEKKGGILGKLIALLLGIIIGFISCIGGVAILGNFLINKLTMEEGFDYINDFTGQNIDYTQYLNGEYGEKTVMELFGVIGDAIAEISDGTGSLNTLNNISPLIGKAIKGDPDSENMKEGVVEKLAEYGIKIDGDKFMDKVIVKPDDAEENPDLYLGDYLMDCINQTPVGDLFEAMDYELNDLLYQLCYGEEGDEPLTIGGFLGDGLEKKINAIPLATLLTPDTQDAIMMSINYGPTHRYKLEGLDIKMMQLFYQFDAETIMSVEPLFNALTNGSGTVIISLNVQGGTAVINDAPYNVPSNFLLDDQGHTLIVENGKYQTAKLVIELNTGAIKLELTDKNGVALPVQYLKLDAPDTTIKLYAYSDEDLAEEHEIPFEKVKVGDLQSEGSNIIRSIALKDALNVTEETTNKLLLAIAYEKNGETQRARTIDDLWTNGSDIINGIHLADMLHVDLKEPLIAYFIYGKQDVHYQKTLDMTWVPTGEQTELDRPYIAVMKPKYVSVITAVEGENTVEQVYNEYGDQYFGNMVTENGKFYCTINNVKFELVLAEDLYTPLAPIEIEEKTATLYYVYDLNGEQVFFEEPTLGELMAENSPILNNIMGHLTVSDILGDAQAGENKIFTLLRDVAIEDMAVEINKLHIVDIFEDDIYEKDEHGNFLIQSGEKVMKPTWEYLLKGEDDEIHTELTIKNGMSTMIDNMTRNIQKASIADLVADGILTLSDTSKDAYEAYLANPSDTSPFSWTITRILEFALTLTPNI